MSIWFAIRRKIKLQTNFRSLQLQKEFAFTLVVWPTHCSRKKRHKRHWDRVQCEFSTFDFRPIHPQIHRTIWIFILCIKVMVRKRINQKGNDLIFSIQIACWCPQREQTLIRAWWWLILPPVLHSTLIWWNTLWEFVLLKYCNFTIC